MLHVNCMPSRINHTNPIVLVFTLNFFNARHAKIPRYFRLRFTWLCHVISWFCALFHLVTYSDWFYSHISARRIFWLHGRLLITSHDIFWIVFAQHILWHFRVGHFSVISHVTCSERSFTPISASRALVMIFYSHYSLYVYVLHIQVA
jgi:hypothetical protein